MSKHFGAPRRAQNRVVSLLLAVALVVAPALALLGAAPAQAANGTVSFVAAANTAGNRTSHTVKVPTTVQAGDTLVLFLTTNSTTSTINNSVAGWTLLQSRDGSGTRARAWTKRAVAADAGATVKATTSVAAKSAMSVTAYRSSTGTSTVTASASAAVNTAATSHTTPAVAVADANSWLVSYWSEKSSTATTWTAPAGTSVRTAAATTGTGKISSILGDSNAAVPTGTAAGRTAKTSTSVGRSQEMSVVVSPGASGVVTNHAPVPSFTSSCAVLTCSFDASGSTDQDNDTLSYTWSFGDVSAPATGTTTTHTYASAGTRTVTLTANDGTTTAQTTRSVSTTAGDPTPGHTRLVPQTPRTDMPKISDGQIWDIEIVGSRVFIAGTFTKIQNQRSTNTTTYTRPSLASYNMDTGLVDTAFKPVFGSGGVDSVEASPDGKRLYVSGDFSTVNGVTKKGVAELDPATGAPVAGFTANTDAKATELAVSNSTVYVGGKFTKVNGVARRSLAAVDALTGVVDAGFVNNLSGGIGTNGEITVQKLKLTHDGTKLLVVHTARQVAGQARSGVALIDTATKQLLPWRSQLWDDNLQFVGGVQRVYGGDISPDDSYFVVTSGSGGDRPPINDTAIRFPIDVPAGTDANNVQPTWVARNFDSVYSVAITEKAVYLGGHFAWNESPSAPDPWPGQDDIGYGTGQGLSGYALGDSVVNREHLGALNPVDGKALEWSPGSNSYEGNKAMEATSRGLFTGGDAVTQGGYNVGRIAFFDFKNETASNGVETTITEPIMGRVLPSGQQFMMKGDASTTTGTVNRVQVEIQNRSTKQYLQDDLTTWGAANTINAPLAAPSAATTTWSLALTIPGNVKLSALARTYNSAGTADATKATKKFETFGLSDAPPTVTIATPLAGVVNTKEFTVTGNAADDLGVVSLSMTMRDEHNRYLQDDGTISSSYNSFHVTPDVVGSTSTGWSKTFVLPTESNWKLQVRASDTGGQSSLDTTDRTWNVFANGQPPVVSLTAPVSVIPPTSPNPFIVPPGQPMTFKGTATDDTGVAAVDVAMINNSTHQNLTVDGTFGTKEGLNFYRVSPAGLDSKDYAWTYTTGFDLTPGNYTFVVRAIDKDGIATPQSNWVFIYGGMNAQVAGDNPPKATITPARQGLHTDVQTLPGFTLDGTATDDKGVSGVQVALKDADTARYLKPDGTTTTDFATVPATLASPGATSSSWTMTVDLPTQGDWNVTALAQDTVGQQDLSSAGATGRYLVYPGDTPPGFDESLTSPTNGTNFDSGRIFISGRAQDQPTTGAMAKVEVAVQSSTGKYMSPTGSLVSPTPVWISAFLTSPGTPGSNFSYTTPVIPTGDYTVTMRGTDQHDLVGPVSTRTAHVTLTPSAAPVAHLTRSCSANVCTFDGRTSTDENAATLTYQWTFTNATTGAVTSATTPVVTKTFPSAATYNVSLVVTDETLVASAPATDSVNIVEPGTNTAPATVFNTPSCSNLSCNLSAQGTTDNAGDTVSYSWSFGDGSGAAPGIATAHTFGSAGTYTVSVTATDGWGKSTTVSRVVTVPTP